VYSIIKSSRRCSRFNVKGICRRRDIEVVPMSVYKKDDSTLTDVRASILKTQIFQIREQMKNTETCLKYLEYIYLGGDPP
jgi:hypothetical protein